MANPMMQMLNGSRNNPLAMLGEFRKFAAGMTPQKAMEWLRENMIPYYPLGVYKDKEVR